jgi:hypothetical protein
MGEALDISGKFTGVGQVCVLFSRHSSIYIVSVFLDIPAVAVFVRHCSLVVQFQ